MRWGAGGGAPADDDFTELLCRLPFRLDPLPISQGAETALRTKSNLPNTHVFIFASFHCQFDDGIGKNVVVWFEIADGDFLCAVQSENVFWKFGSVP